MIKENRLALQGNVEDIYRAVEALSCELINPESEVACSYRHVAFTDLSEALREDWLGWASPAELVLQGAQPVKLCFIGNIQVALLGVTLYVGTQGQYVRLDDSVPLTRVFGKIVGQALDDQDCGSDDGRLKVSVFSQLDDRQVALGVMGNLLGEAQVSDFACPGDRVLWYRPDQGLRGSRRFGSFEGRGEQVLLRRLRGLGPAARLAVRRAHRYDSWGPRGELLETTPVGQFLRAEALRLARLSLAGDVEARRMLEAAFTQSGMLNRTDDTGAHWPALELLHGAWSRGETSPVQLPVAALFPESGMRGLLGAGVLATYRQVLRLASREELEAFSALRANWSGASLRMLSYVLEWMKLPETAHVALPHARSDVYSVTSNCLRALVDSAPMVERLRVATLLDVTTLELFERVQDPSIFHDVLLRALRPEVNIEQRVRREVYAERGISVHAGVPLRVSSIPEGRWQYQGSVLDLQQLISQEELTEESRVLSHCVGYGGYFAEAQMGNAVLFGLRINGTPAVTIEVRHRTVVQARGRHNSVPDALLSGLIRSWAAQAGLTVNCPLPGSQMTWSAEPLPEAMSAAARYELLSQVDAHLEARREAELEVLSRLSNLGDDQLTAQVKVAADRALERAIRFERRVWRRLGRAVRAQLDSPFGLLSTHPGEEVARIGDFVTGGQFLHVNPDGRSQMVFAQLRSTELGPYGLFRSSVHVKVRLTALRSMVSVIQGRNRTVRTQPLDQVFWGLSHLPIPLITFIREQISALVGDGERDVDVVLRDAADLQARLGWSLGIKARRVADRAAQLAWGAEWTPGLAAPLPFWPAQARTSRLEVCAQLPSGQVVFWNMPQRELQPILAPLAEVLGRPVRQWADLEEALEAQRQVQAALQPAPGQFFEAEMLGRAAGGEPFADFDLDIPF